MASFPTSVFSPSARSNGQVIDASHINDLQGEVTAIEDGFRNATAPLNSSKSTLAALSVTGNSTLGAMTAGASTLASLSVTGNSTVAALNVTGTSTFAGKLNVASTAVSLGDSTTGLKEIYCSSLYVAGVAVAPSVGSTFTSLQVTAGSTLATLNVTGGSTFASIPVMPRAPYCRVRLTADLNVGNATSASPNWDTEVVDADGLHSTSVNSSRVNLTSSGVWQLEAHVVWRLISSGTMEVSLVANDNQWLAKNQTYNTSTSASTSHPQGIVTTYFTPSTTEYITVLAWQEVSTKSLNGSTFNGGCYLAALRVSQ